MTHGRPVAERRRSNSRCVRRWRTSRKTDAVWPGPVDRSRRGPVRPTGRYSLQPDRPAVGQLDTGAEDALRRGHLADQPSIGPGYDGDLVIRAHARRNLYGVLRVVGADGAVNGTVGDPHVLGEGAPPVVRRCHVHVVHIPQEELDIILGHIHVVVAVVVPGQVDAPSGGNAHPRPLLTSTVPLGIVVHPQGLTPRPGLVPRAHEEHIEVAVAPVGPGKVERASVG